MSERKNNKTFKKGLKIMSTKIMTVDDWYAYLLKNSKEFRIMGMDEQGEVCVDCVKCVEGKSHISSALAFHAVREVERNNKERNAYNR